ncbi:MAG: hypothetical protein ACR2MA_12420 [Egibacteraceae bacterium]
MDAVFDSSGLSAWAAAPPPDTLIEALEVAARTGGAAVVPTVAVVEVSTGRSGRDARLNQRLKRPVHDPCSLDVLGAPDICGSTRRVL